MKFEVEFECFVHEKRLAKVEADSKQAASRMVEDGEYEDSYPVDMDERTGKILSVAEVKK